MISWERKYLDARRYLLRMRSREVLVFLFFLAVSATFWLLSTLNETYETELKIPLRLEGIPARVVVTDELSDTVRCTVRDKGFRLLQYGWIDELKAIVIPFNRYAAKDGKGSVPASDIQKLIRQQLSESTAIVSLKASHLDFFYIYGVKRRLPVVLEGQAKAAPDYYVMRTMITPDSVDVYASEQAFDTLQAVYTEPLNVEGLQESATVVLPLLHNYGSRVGGDATVKVDLLVDQLTEVVLSVPVKTVNVPDGTQLKTFPARVNVKVSVGRQVVKQIRAEYFTVVADYRDLPENPGAHLPLKILTQPKNIVRASIQNGEVDYIIEHVSP